MYVFQFPTDLQVTFSNQSTRHFHEVKVRKRQKSSIWDDHRIIFDGHIGPQFLLFDCSDNLSEQQRA